MVPTKNEIMHKNDWVSLKDYFDDKFALLEKLIDSKIEAVCKDIDKSSEATNARLQGLNKLREAMADQAAHYLTKEEYTQRHDALAEKMETLMAFMNTMKGKASQNAMLLTAALSIVGFVTALISLLVKLFGK